MEVTKEDNVISKQDFKKEDGLRTAAVLFVENSKGGTLAGSFFILTKDSPEETDC